MKEFVLNFFNASINSGCLILAVIILRLVFKKTHKRIICALWAVVGLRLLLPFTLESPISLLPRARVLPEEFIYSTLPHIDTGIGVVDDIFNPIMYNNMYIVIDNCSELVDDDALDNDPLYGNQGGDNDSELDKDTKLTSIGIGMSAGTISIGAGLATITKKKKKR